MSNLDEYTDAHSGPGRRGFTSGDQHGWMQAMCDNFAAMLLGRFAAAWLDGEYGRLPSWGAVVAQPIWMWIDPGLRAGRKVVSIDGGHLLLPVRVQWEPAPLTVVPTGESVDMPWQAVGVGHSGRGVSHVAVGPASRHVEADRPTSSFPAPSVYVPSTNVSNIRGDLEALVTAGQEATWDAIGRLEPYVDRACQTAAGALAAEIAGEGASTPLLDEVSIETIRDTMLFGDGESESAIGRLLNICLAPSSFQRVDPMRYIKVRLRQEAAQHMQRAIGDPRIGPKVRRVYRHHQQQQQQQQRTTLAKGEQPGGDEGFIARYNSLYPADHLAAKRALQALSVGPIATARTIPITSVSDDDDPRAESVEPSVTDDHRITENALDASRVLSEAPEMYEERIADIRERLIKNAKRTLKRSANNMSRPGAVVAARIVAYGPTLAEIAEVYVTKYPDDPIGQLLTKLAESQLRDAQ